MADMIMEMSHFRGRSGRQRASYQRELEREKMELKNQMELKHLTTERELQKHKTNLADLEIFHQKCMQEIQKDMVHWREQAEVAQRELQAKASQVKQYAKENKKLKEDIEQLRQCDVRTVLYCIHVAKNFSV